MEVVDIGMLAQGQSERSPCKAKDAGEAIARFGQPYNPYPFYHRIPVMLGDQSDIIARPHQRLCLLVEDAGVEGRMDGGEDANIIHWVAPTGVL